MIDRILELPRIVKRGIIICIDVVMVIFSFWLSYWLRLDEQTAFLSAPMWFAAAILTIFTVFIFIRIGLYRAVLRYVSAKIMLLIPVGILASTLSLVVISYSLSIMLPRTVVGIYFLVLLLLTSGSRLLFRMILNYGVKGSAPVLIYGAGESGRQLLPALMQAKEYFPVAFVDDNPRLHKAVIHGVTVYPSDKLSYLVDRYGIKKILLAMPSVSKSQRQKVITRLEHLPCEVLSIPGMVDLVEGRAQISNLKKVSIDDLLGRDPVAPDAKLMAENITGKAVMVTGAGGSIGSELCRQIVRYKPAKLVLFELSEYALYAIEKELSALCDKEVLNVPVIPLLGSVQRQNRLQMVMKSFGIQTVYHAAAYKHVPLVEHNVVEGVRNNVFGTLYCAESAIESGVETFVLISTDKAVRPTNTMGTTKRLAELVLQALSARQSQTRFCMVRFGNVLGSSGSVVPLFEKQIAQGGPVTLTHRDIIRYFMTIPEASQLVIQAGAMGHGGDVFVLDMGDPVKIYDLAKRMIRLSGLSVRDDKNPDGDIAIEVTGLRPGEKLYEELLIGDSVQGTSHPRIMTANEVMLPWQDLSLLLKELDQACHDFDHERIRSLLLQAPAAFNPTDDICDLVWQQKKSLLSQASNVIRL
ncbi:TPA: polysaccharide biosynthesis protein [Shigella sonnei]|uniref:Epimerase/dehydratase n=9 Tax=Shigella TaxID=620 RepID=Q3YTB2_SHISS|nr:nucleoside-diphosphate sugar epimerase/dehydratase [Shigella sonnei]EBW8917281.1 polysaccharide biosynthesis protein [Salmonella enterica subsp. enterica serovar Enteritidis]EEZ6792795.1 polysaccharide biosynthesis protein [Escherichia coli]EFT6124486.1 NAD-dependent epimerase/dehydratase family protein [Shigella flexneri]EFZ3599340.1 polysaccharide biosynthesis protein [Shigella boydii]EJL11816.1 short chain dehydrogenase family protein [Shigella sonnei str. Moseley]